MSQGWEVNGYQCLLYCSITGRRTKEVNSKSMQKKKKNIYLPNESHIKLNRINAKGGLPEEQTLINAGRPYNNYSVTR